MSIGTAPASILGEQLLDAAERCFERYGVVQTRVQDVADEAGVSMATLYRHVQGREGLVVGVASRHVDAVVAQLGTVIANHPDLRDGFVAAVLHTVDKIRTSELLRALVTPEAVGLTLSVPGAAELFLERAAQLLEPIMAVSPFAEQLRPGLSATDIAEWVGRVIDSLVRLPALTNRSDAELGAYLHRLLVPAIFVDR